MPAQNRKSKASAWTRLLVVLLSLCITLTLSLVSWGSYLLWRVSTTLHPFAFRHVRVVMQAQHLNDNQILSLVRKNLNGGFFSLNAKILRQALLEEPWVAEVAFRRVWPDLLEVAVEEQKPIARWGETQLISATGHLFTPAANTRPLNLPFLLGPDHMEQQVFLSYKRFQNYLAPLGVAIKELQLTTNHSWVITLDQGTEVKLGHEEVGDRLKRFVNIYQSIIDKSKSKALSVDLRYAHGAAIQWE